MVSVKVHLWPLQISYEAYGAGGTGFICECLTDNINRSAFEVRTAVTKGGGKMAEVGEQGGWTLLWACTVTACMMVPVSALHSGGVLHGHHGEQRWTATSAAWLGEQTAAVGPQ